MHHAHIHLHTNPHIDPRVADINKASLVSDVLGSANISLYYLSTFGSDFVLVPQASLTRALECLAESPSILFED
jgi:ACT domain